MDEMLLDPAGNMPIPPGYRAIDNEVTFLQQATEGVPLMVRGTRLCHWAADFWRGRSIPFRELLPPAQLLSELAPTLSDAEAQAISQALPDELLATLDKLSLTELLQSLFPNLLWQTRPSKNHAADWLLWLYERSPKAVFEPLLAEQSRLWQREVDDASKQMYTATNATTALRLLEIWLGLTPDPLLRELGQFPHELPQRLHDHAARVWKDRIITGNGTLLIQLEELPIRPELMKLAAQETVEYLEHHSGTLNGRLRDQLVPYLTTSEQNRLLSLLPPPLPGELPAEPAGIIAWFRDQYLPARQWQTVYGSEVEAAKIRAAAEQFACWYLEQYPRALNGGALSNHLSFMRAAATKRETDSQVTLLIVMDGLHSLDAQQLLQGLQRLTDRLTVLANDLTFAPLPTVTKICKPALFAGVVPEHAEQVPTLGAVVPENSSPIEALNNALPGEVYLWRILEPDRTYHRQNSSETLQQDIEGRLFSLAKKIGEIVKKVRSEVPLRLILTSDHGRLLAKAVRKLDVPAGMQSEGRTALGMSGRTFDESGFIIEGDIVYLHAARFGLPSDAAIAFSEDTFRMNDGKTGSEWYPHGGLYPEEVLVPWIDLVRDVAPPDLVVKLSGNGQAGQRGELVLHLLNRESTPLTITALNLSLPGRQQKQQLNIAIKPLEKQSIPLPWEKWPNKAEAEQLVAKLSLRLSNNLVFDITAEDIQLEISEMYQRADILGDLDL